MEISSELRAKDTWLISEDGLWDICLGLVLFGWGLTIFLRHPLWFISAMMVSYFLVIMAGKEIFTRPRMNFFSIADENLIRLERWIRVGILCVMIGLAFGALAFWVIDFSLVITQLSSYGMNIVCLILSLVMLILGNLSQSGNRYHFYAGIFFIGFIVINLLSISNLTLIFLTALLLTVTGILLLIRFVSRYPKSQAEGNVQY
jgi:hypothetical protein